MALGKSKMISFWLVSLALIVTKPLLSSSDQIPDGTWKNPLVVEVYFDRLLDGIKELAIATANDTTNISTEMTLSFKELMKTRRYRRSFWEDNFASPTTCSLTESELNEIKNLLQAVGKDEERSQIMHCDNLLLQGEPLVANWADSPRRCSQMIESIIRNVDDVKKAFHCLKSKSDVNNDRYEKLKAAYEAKHHKLNLQLANVEKKFDQKFKTQIDNLKKSYHQLENKMNHIIIELQNEQISHLEVIVKLVIAYLKSGEIQLARDVFNTKSIDTVNNVIEEIVKQAVAKELGANFPITNLTNCIESLRESVKAESHFIIILFNEWEKRRSVETFDHDWVLHHIGMLHVKIEEIINQWIDLENSKQPQLLGRNVFNQLLRIYYKLDNFDVSLTNK